MEKHYLGNIYFGLKPFVSISPVDEKLKKNLQKDFFKKKRRIYKFSDSTYAIDFSQVTHMEFREMLDE